MSVNSLTPEKSSLVESLHQQIKNEIYEFRMMPGDRYSEYELAAGFGVSRTPLRMALLVLSREGFLNKVDGHASWQVRPLDLRYFEDLYDLRVNLEIIAVKRICALDPFPDFEAQRVFWNAPEGKRVTDGAKVGAADEALHSALVSAAGNREMARVHQDITERIRMIRRLDFIQPERIAAAFDEHAKLLRALYARKADRAELLIRAHIETSKAEIRHITLHRLTEARDRRETPAKRKGANRAI